MVEHESIRDCIRRYANELAALVPWPGRVTYTGIYDLVAREGREYQLAPIPPELRSRRARSPGKCFHRTFLLSTERDDLLYVEGFAATQQFGPIHHAWLTSGNGDAIDLAWEPPGTEYLGVAIDGASLGKATTSRTQVVGYLENLDLFQHGFGPETLELAEGER